jgi:hypothetical protein
MMVAIVFILSLSKRTSAKRYKKLIRKKLKHFLLVHCVFGHKLVANYENAHVAAVRVFTFPLQSALLCKSAYSIENEDACERSSLAG